MSAIESGNKERSLFSLTENRSKSFIIKSCCLFIRKLVPVLCVCIYLIAGTRKNFSIMFNPGTGMVVKL